MVQKEAREKNDMEALMDLFNDMAHDRDGQAWHLHRSIFMSTYLKVTFDFSEEIKKVNTFGLTEDEIRMNEGIPTTFGKISDVNLHIDELKIMKNGKPSSEEAHYFNAFIQDGKALYTNSGFKTLVDTFYNSGMPLAPFPIIEHCLGLSPKDSSMAIKDGYAVLAFDYQVDTADDNCLFNMGSGASGQKAKKEVRMIDRLLKMSKGKTNMGKYKGLLEGMKKNLMTVVTKGVLDDEVEIPALPFKVPSFNIAGVKIDLNDK